MVNLHKARATQLALTRCVRTLRQLQRVRVAGGLVSHAPPNAVDNRRARARPTELRIAAWFVSGLLASHRREIGTRKGTRRLGCFRQALFGLAWFRDKGDIRRLGAGFGLSQSTAYRYLDEVIGVLAARAGVAGAAGAGAG